MKINSDQKSVLTLWGIILVGLLIAHHNIFSIEAIVVWGILVAWFYGVRTKNRPKPTPPSPPKP